MEKETAEKPMWIDDTAIGSQGTWKETTGQRPAAQNGKVCSNALDIKGCGVEIPQKVIEDSMAKKQRQKRTLAQLPVYRATGNLMYVVAAIVKNSPKHLRKFFDLMMCDVAEVQKAIGMADISRNDEDRVWYINSALVLMNGEKMYFTILQKLDVMPKPGKGKTYNAKMPGATAKEINAMAVNKDLANKVDALVKSIVAQLVAWRDNPRGEGIAPFLKREEKIPATWSQGTDTPNKLGGYGE